MHTKHRLGWPGNRKIFRVLRAQLLSIYRAGSSWLTGPMKVNLKHMR